MKKNKVRALARKIKERIFGLAVAVVAVTIITFLHPELIPGIIKAFIGGIIVFIVLLFGTEFSPLIIFFIAASIFFLTLGYYYERKERKETEPSNSDEVSS